MLPIRALFLYLTRIVILRDATRFSTSSLISLLHIFLKQRIIIGGLQLGLGTVDFCSQCACDQILFSFLCEWKLGVQTYGVAFCPD